MELTEIGYWKALINIGFTKILVLKVLSGGANHGYGILKELQVLTSGCCTPTLGTIYPILKELTKKGYAEVVEEQQLKGAQKRRVYTLTPSGSEAYRVALEAWKSSIPSIYRAIEGAEPLSAEEIKIHLSLK
ncbi:MAG: PadR family transcriptional regulator [Syntrophales bacterium]